MPRSRNLFANGIRSGLRLICRTRLPKVDGHIRLAGLHAPLEIIRDQWGVPHIYAENDQDLFFGQGFVHAQDRLWQMEYSRRLVAGRMSEVFGERTLALDRWMRTLTMRRVAEYEVNLVDEPINQLLQAYANGVNACMARGRYPIEFTLLRIRPEPWVIADTLSWIKMMAWSLSVNWEAELLRAQLVARLGPEAAADLEHPHLKRWPYIIPPGSIYEFPEDWNLERARQARPFSGPSPYSGLGSNNWAISGKLSSGGGPIFANDMHLSLTAPAIWYENHLVSNNLNVIGVTLPCIPGVISGHNGRVSWGYTNGFADVQDLYLEKLRHNADGTFQSEYKGEWEDAHVINETIRVKGKPSETEQVIITRHGPIINNLAPGFSGEQPLALRWTSLEPDGMINGLFSMLHAGDCDELHSALRLWTGPVQNVVSADSSGNISYSFVGKIPIRSRGNGRLPVPGWTDEYEWTGYVPFEALPHAKNPPQGYIVTANNRVFGDDYPVRIELEPISGDRAQRISEMILDSNLRNGDEKLSIEFVQRMQFDLTSPSARLVARFINAIFEGQSAHSPQTELYAALQLIKDWDGTLNANSPAAGLYQIFIRRLTETLLLSHLNGQPPDRRQNSNQFNLSERFMGKGPTPILAELSLFGERWLPWLTNILQSPDSPWFNLGQGETRDDVVRQSLQQSYEELKKRFGPDPNKWHWGRLHKVTFQHILADNSNFAGLFNRGPYPVGGDSTTVWATGTSYHNLNTENMVGPGYRMIVDLSNIDNSLSMLAPGQSGNPASLHYDDQVKGWFSGKYHQMLYTQETVKAAACSRLRISP